MKRFAIGLTTLLAASALHAQVPQMPTPPGMRDPQAMLKAMEAAQAAAHRPGDEALSCAQLEKMIHAAVQDPAFQAYLQASAAAAQRELAAQQPTAAEMAAKARATAAASTVPGASAAHLYASAVENQARVAAGQARLQSMVTQSDEAMRFMPLILRAQRLVELGVARHCAWTGDASLGLGTPFPIQSPPR